MYFISTLVQANTITLNMSKSTRKSLQLLKVYLT